MMRGYTTVEQSKKLAEILPLESADFFWIIGHLHTDGARYAIIRPRNEVVEVEKYWPCWSLAALLDVLPKNIGRYTKSLYWFDDAWHCEYEDEDGEGLYGESADEPIDACYEMIMQLNKKDLL